jgi:hypothetical protein
MGGKRRIAVVLMAAALLAGLAAGCGGGSSSASGDSENSTPGVEPEPNLKFGKRPGPEVVKFGEEADVEEREAASAVLEENFQARAAGEWGKQCASMTVEQAEEVRETTEPNGNCVTGLRIQASPLAQTQAFRANPMTGPIYALRVLGSRGFALYHGKKGKEYAMAMKKEDGEWKVDDLTATELPELP